MSELKLEVGKVYRTRDGRRVEITGECSESRKKLGYSYTGCGKGFGMPDWTSSGFYISSESPSEKDLVAEWVESAAHTDGEHLTTAGEQERAAQLACSPAENEFRERAFLAALTGLCAGTSTPRADRGLMLSNPGVVTTGLVVTMAKEIADEAVHQWSAA